MNIDDLSLTDRQLQLWRMIADGFSAKQIAGATYQAQGTVEARRRVLYRKLGVHNAAEATRLAVARGVVTTEWAPVGAEVVA